MALSDKTVDRTALAALLPEAAWLAVLPRAPPGPGPRGTAVRDPAGPARADAPMTAPVLLAGLSESSPILAAAARVQLFLAPFARHTIARNAAWFVSFIPLLALPWVFNDGSFGTKELAVGTATVCFGMLGATMGLAIFAAYGASLSVAPDYSTHAAAGLVRWVQMTKGRMPTDHGFIDLPLSPLLEHQDGDPHCPCSKQSCAGGIPVRAGWLLGFEIGFKLCYTLANVLLISWTPLAYPNIARSVWTTPWPAFFGALYWAVGIFAIVAPVCLVRFSHNVAMLRLAERVESHAMNLALDSMLSPYRTAAASGPSHFDADALPPRPAAFDLYALFAAEWQRRVRQFNASSPMIVSTSCMLVGAILNPIFCSCIPALYLMYIGYNGLMQLIDLVNVAAANATIDRIRGQLLDALRELRELRRELVRTAPPALLALLDSDADALAPFLDVERFRARLLGIPVVYGVVRTLLVTVFTLAVGLWSILRGLGVYLTMQSICPATG